MRTTPALLLAMILAGAGRADVLYCRASLTTGANDGSSWADAFRGPLALQSALAQARAGDRIWLAQGTYKPAPAGGARTATFRLISGVEVLGGFAGTETAPDQRVPGRTSTLSGDLNGNDAAQPDMTENVARVVTGENLSSDTLLDSLTVVGGNFNLNPDVHRGDGGGLVLVSSAAVVRGCVFRGNHSSSLGGGAAVHGGSPVFEGCTFDANNARSGYNLAALGSGDVAVRGCRFVGDCRVTGGSAGIGILSGPVLADPNDHPHLLVEDCLFAMADTGFACPAGMGVYASQGAAVILRSDFIGNRSCGGGGGVSGDATFTIDRCRFIGNEGSADGGAAIHTFGGRYTVSNSLFHANDREGFSTISVQGGAFRAVNCTFSSNGSTVGLGGGFHNVVLTSVPGVLLQNCIFWGNIARSGNPVSSPGSPARFDRCLVQGWDGTMPGFGSFAADPLFTDPDGQDGVLGTADDDLRLRPGSPALDRADGAVLDGAFDLAGHARFRDDPQSPNLGAGPRPYADLGAYEFQPPCPADVNGDGFLDFFDYDAFVAAFEAGAAPADFNADGFLDFFDYDAFIGAFEQGC